MSEKQSIGFFEKYLTLWVILCMATGVAIGLWLPVIRDFLGQFEYYNVSIPVAVLIWLMIYPMMLKVDFASIRNVGRNPKGLVVTWVTNWLVKPFTMFGLAYLFFFVIFKSAIPAVNANGYLAGAILLGAAPCTAMVFVWSHLTKGNPAHTLVQVATNDLIILIAFAPVVGLLFIWGGIEVEGVVAVPWPTLFLSVVLFVVIPLGAGWLTRSILTKKKGKEYFEQKFIPKFNNVTAIGLLLTLVIIFSFQGDTIVSQPVDILMIAVPLIVQTFLIFFIAYFWSRAWKLPHNIASPAAMIGASNFFELAVAVAISVFGLNSPAALATIVGVLVEVPVMLALVRFANRTRGWFPANEGSKSK
ncbi:MAG: ACR3 family arsenite efflux transporter [Eubacteriales bacterium]|nr:ACR3 family arsenite efflux transporter [Eubacteriales bacterium]